MASKCGLVVAAALGLMGAFSAGAAVVPYRVKDINPIPFPASSQPGGVVPFGGIDLFAADDGSDGRELWRTDGSAAGTYELVDACPGKCSSFPRVFAVAGHSAFFLTGGESQLDLWVTRGTPRDTFHLAQVGLAASPLWVASRGLLFFIAGADSRLWRSDGTPAGTYPLGDVSASSFTGLVELQGRVYFGSRDALHGTSLWRTDGTPGGTVLLWASSRVSDNPLRLLRVLGKRLLFVATGPSGDPLLWSSDGTSHPPILVASLAAEDAVVFAVRLLLVTATDTAGQLWASDGTAAGTRLLATFSSPHPFPQSGLSAGTFLAGRFLFTADDGVHGAEPWVTDGSRAGTRLLKDVCPGSCSGSASFFQLPGSAAYFSAADPSRGRELWITDGTPAGTRLVRDLCPGPCNGSPQGLQLIKGKAVFAAHAADGRSVLWRTDGTRQGTARITDLGPGSSIGSFGYPYPGGVLFVATEAVHGTEIWRTDGTAAGTAIVKDIASADLGGSNPSGFMAAAGKVFFFANDGSHGYELWTSDGTAGGTRRVEDLTPGPEPHEPPHLGASTEAAGVLFFLTLPARHDTFKLWRSDGTAAGTLPLPGDAGSELCAVGGTVFYVGIDDHFHSALWKTDGTPAGTQLVSGGPSSFGQLTAFRGRLFLAAGTPESGVELWASDGTPAGTVLVKDINAAPGVSSYPFDLTEHNGSLYFFADDGEHGRELWASDGTTGGTDLVADLVPGSGSFAEQVLVSTGSRLFFIGRDEAELGLWTSDGTAAGTRKVAALPGAFAPSGPSAVFQGRFYFTQTVPGAGPALWASDGTPAGTGPVLDRDGQPVGAVGSLNALSHHLYFTRIGNEDPLWQSDGTPAGTLPVEGPPGLSLDYGQPFVAGARLFFAGNDPVAGNELWALGPD